LALEKALLSLKSEGDLRLFLEDLLSEAEIREFRNRWQAACLLEAETSYSEIEASTGLSSTTVARVSRCLQGKGGGYRLVFEKLR